MGTFDLGLHFARLYLTWVLIAMSSIGIVLALISLLLGLDALHKGSEHALLLLLPVAAYQLGRLRDPSWCPG